MANIEDFTGSIKVDSNITPITRKKIEQVSANEWHKMPTASLVEERITLYNRMSMASECGSVEMVSQIQKGIDVLDALISR